MATPQPLMPFDTLRVLTLCLVLRGVNALIVRTTFAPDEYWQSLEVAHRLVFGYGHLTWEWAAGLRSYLHPTLFAGLYWLLQALGLDSPWAVAKGPMLLQAVLASATDVAVFATTQLLFGHESARWALACQLLSWFNFYCSVRTYSNCLEAVLTSAAVYYWLLCTEAVPGAAAAASKSSSPPPSRSGVGSGEIRELQHPEGAVVQGAAPEGEAIRMRRKTGVDAALGSGLTSKMRPQHELEERTDHVGTAAPVASRRRHRQRRWLLLATLSAVIRPPSALFWAALGLHQLIAQRDPGLRLELLLDAAGFLGCCISGATLLDRWYYGRWVLVPLEFLRFNLLSGQSALYGSHPWHWNISQGFPAIAGTLLPLMVAGLLLSRDCRLAWLAGLQLAVYSLPAHKEFRFLLPALQLAMPYCGPALALARQLGSRKAARPVGREVPPATAAKGAAGGVGGLGDRQGSSTWRPRQGAWRRTAAAVGLAALALAQASTALYFSLVHHRGLAQVPGEIRRLWEDSPAAATVLFLTQCHATPWYSHIHAPVPMRFLDCSPPGWAQTVAALNAGELGWLRLPMPTPCSAPFNTSGPTGTGCSSQQQLFKDNPAAFLEQVLASNPAPPGAIVGYEAQLAGLRPLLEQHGYYQYRRIVNCWWQTDEDTPCLVALWRRGAVGDGSAVKLGGGSLSDSSSHP